MSEAVYIAARFSRRPEANQMARKLKELGHTISSRWVKPKTDHVIPTGLSRQAADAERERFAKEDVADVLDCTWMISLMEEPRSNSRGGRHVEFGLALGLGRKLTIIGPRETVFHHLPQVEHFDTVGDFWQVYGAYRAESLAALQAHADALAGAVSKLKLRDLVAGWNGENREAGPFEPHPAKLRTTLTTNAGIVYALDEALRAYEAFKAGEPT